MGSGADEGLTPLAQRVPKVKQTASQSENNRRHRIRDYMVNLIDYICKNPEMAPDLWVSVSGGSLVGSGPDSGSSTSGTKQINRPSFGGKIPADVLANWMLSVEGAPPKNVLDTIDSQDKDAVRDMFTYLCQIRPSDKVPDSATVSLPVFNLMLTKRLAQVAPRLPGFFAQVVAGDGAVKWNKCPLYRTEFEGERLQTITHISGDSATLPDFINISRSYTLENPHDDMAACFTMPVDKQFIHQFFAADKGPNKHSLDKKGRIMATLADKAAEEVAEQEKKLEDLTHVSSEPVLESRQKNIRQEALQRAREALSRQAKKARTIEFLE